MEIKLPDTFPITVYDLEEIRRMGFTIEDILPKILKGTQYWVLKKDVAAELEWSKKKFVAAELEWINGSGKSYWNQKIGTS